MVILQDLARFWQKFLQDDVSSCKILPNSGKILQDNHSDPAWELTNIIPFDLGVFQKKKFVKALFRYFCQIQQY